MTSILVVSADRASLAALTGYLENQAEVELLHAASGKAALNTIGKKPVDLVVVDEDLTDMSGLAFVRRLVAANPMIYCAVVSSLPGDDFHEASEGLGVLAQLPVSPTTSDTRDLLAKLDAFVKRLRWDGKVKSSSSRRTNLV